MGSTLLKLEFYQLGLLFRFGDLQNYTTLKPRFGDVGL